MVTLRSQVTKWYKAGILRRYKALMKAHFPEVHAKLVDSIGQYKTKHLYNLINGKSATWNPGCSRPGCQEFVGFKDKFIDGYKPYCSSACSANDPALKARRGVTCLRIYGTENAAASDIVKDRIRKTSKANGSYSKAEATRRQTLLARTNGKCENVSQLPGVQDRVRTTNLLRYNHKHANAQPERRLELSSLMSKDGARRAAVGAATLMRKHGVANAMLIPGIVAKLERKSLAKHGVRNPMQRPDVFKTQRTRAHCASTWRFRGKVFSVQGYEKAQIRYLASVGIAVKDMTQGLSPIDYTKQQAPHRYYPDLFVDNGKHVLVVETKSMYTAWESNRKLRVDVRIKAKAAVKEHGNFLMLVFAGPNPNDLSGFYLVTSQSSNFSKLRFRMDVSILPKLLRVFM